MTIHRLLRLWLGYCPCQPESVTWHLGTLGSVPSWLTDSPCQTLCGISSFYLYDPSGHPGELPGTPGGNRQRETCHSETDSETGRRSLARNGPSNCPFPGCAPYHPHVAALALCRAVPTPILCPWCIVRPLPCSLAFSLHSDAPSRMLSLATPLCVHSLFTEPFGPRLVDITRAS